MDAVYEILMRSFLLFTWFTSGVAALAGAGLLIAPGRTMAVNRFLGRWIDTAAFGVELDRPRRLERYFYRHHRWTGAAMTLGAAYVLYMFLIAHAMRKVQNYLGSDSFGLLDAFSAVIVIVSSLGLFLGIAMFSRPSLLRELESAANQWISTDGILHAFNRMHLSLESLIFRRRILFGLFFLIGGSYSVERLTQLLLSGDWRILLGS